MVAGQRLTELRLRKEALLLESDLNRLALRAEWEHLRAWAGWTNRLAGIRNSVRPWAGLLAPAAGLALALGLRRRSGWLGFLSRAATVIGPLLQLWRTHGAPPNEPQT
jgi:hypothetical protein